MVAVVERYVDVNFTDEADELGVLMGAKDDRGDWLMGARPDFGAQGLTLYDEADWPALIAAKDAANNWISEYITRVYNQNGDPSCVTNAFLQAHEIAQALTLGKSKVIQMAVSSVYPQVGNRVSGSSLSSNLRVLTNWGAIPLDNEANRKLVTAGHIKHVMPENGFPRLASDAADTAGKFKILEVIDIRTYKEAVSALLQNWAVVYARSGHCIIAVRVFNTNRTYKFGYANSWGKWGSKLNTQFEYGMGFDSMNVFRAASSWCVAVRLCQIPDFQYAMTA